MRIDPSSLNDERFLLAQLSDAVNQLTNAVNRLDRTIQGEEAEGNEGILNRLSKVEKALDRLYWSFPFLVLGGTALGQVVAKWLGLG